MKQLYTKSSDINGTGLFTAEPIKKGEHIAFIKGERKTKIIKNKKDSQSIPTWYGITTSEWIDPTGTIWESFNHSCEPNTAIVGTKKLIALKNIKKNAELTVDYSMTDGDLLWELDAICGCGSKNCRGKIKSIQQIPEKVFQKHLPFIPKYFIKLRKDYLRSAKMK